MLLTLAETGGQLAGIPQQGLGQGALKGAAQTPGLNTTKHQTRDSQRDPEFTMDRQEKNLAEFWQDPGDSFSWDICVP